MDWGFVITYAFGVFSGIILFITYKSAVITSFFKAMEMQFLFAAFGLIQYKYQAIHILKVAYDAAAEKDPSKKEEYEEVESKIHQKFDGFGDSWVQDLKNRLPYDTEYNDFNSALRYVERLINEKKTNL